MTKLNRKLKQLFSNGTKQKGKKAKAAPRKRTAAHKSATPPDLWWRRWLWYLHPQRFRDWWFTRPGALAALKIAGVATGIILLAIVGLFLYFAKDLPSPGQINARQLDQTTRFYDRTGEQVLYEVYGDQNRTYIDLEDMGPYVADATIAVEDKNFRNQGAFSSLGIIRAAIYNVLSIDRGGLQGGSTITQQYVKNALLTKEQTITRKIKELILSIQIEQLYEKDDILELYLNEIGYGAQAYGVQAASQMYFSKDTAELSLDEAALLAALPQAPTYYSPYGQNTEDLVFRMHIVLDLMAEQGYITEEEAAAAKEVDTLANVNETPDAFRNIEAPHFVIRAQEQLEEKYGAQEVIQGGLQIITTIDLDLQHKAEAAVEAGIAAVEAGGGNNAALVASDPNNGQVLAMVGSRDFSEPGYGAYNAATAKRQPGSSFKPYAYAQAFAETKDWGPGSIMYDVRTDFGGGYIPNNYDGGFAGNMTIRSALARSRNIPAVKMLYIAGIENTLNLVERMGITTLGDPSNYGLSLVLGAGEVQLNQHVSAYETFANGGLHHEQVTILKITDPDGNIIEEWEESEGERIFDPQVPYLISSILSDDSARAPTFGANSPYFNIPGHTVAAKTGTTDNFKDGWIMGYTKSLVTGIWVGHNDNEAMHAPTDTMTGPIFSRFMATALEGQANQPFERPEGIKTVTLDRYTGDRASDNSSSTVTDIFPSWYTPRGGSDLESALVNTATNRRINDSCPAHEDFTSRITSYGLRAEIPPADPAFSRWNPPVQALASRLDIRGGGEIPEREDNCNSQPQINESESSAEYDNDEITIRVALQGGVADEVRLTYNGSTAGISADGNSGGAYIFRYTPEGGSGSYTFEAVVIRDGLFDTATITCPESGSCSEVGDGGSGGGLSWWRRLRN
ncbi:MAG: transglycosylase domain-containing protein [Candidatus Saccharimonadales bacterium]